MTDIPERGEFNVREAFLERGPGDVLYADASTGSDDNDGTSWTRAKATIGACLALVDEGGTVYINGKFKEQLVLSNLLGGVSIIGAATRLPSYADAPWASGGTWLAPDSPAATTPLLELRSQGCTLENILFDAPSDAAAVKLSRNALSGNSEYDASHVHIKNCRFTGGATGIEDAAGCYGGILEDCRFHQLTHAFKNTSTAVDVPTNWIIQRNWFVNNTNHIVNSLKWSLVQDNFFGVFTTTSLSFRGAGTNGTVNIVTKNYLSGTYSENGGYKDGVGDEWAGNFNTLSGGITVATPG